MPGKRGWQKTVAFLSGLYFGFLQLAYFFALEIYFSSRAYPFFIALFFWLSGFLIGLNLKRTMSFLSWVYLGLGAYYVTLVLQRIFPYRPSLLAVTALAILVSSVAVGQFFITAQARFTRVRDLFFWENNGFMLGVVLALIGTLWVGKYFLHYGPVLGAVPLWFLDLRAVFGRETALD